MNKIKYYLLFLLGVIMVGCSVENDYVANRDSELKIKNVTLKDMKMKQGAFTTFRDAVTAPVNPLHRVVYNEDYGVYYDTESIVHMQKGNFESFTIPVIKQENDSLLKNLVVYRKSAEQPFGVKLYGYKLTDADMERLKNKEYLDLRDKAYEETQNQTNTTSVSWIDGSGCLVTMTIDYYPGTMCGSGEHAYGEPCNLSGSAAATQPRIVIKYYYAFCDNGSQNGGGPTGPTIPPTGPPGGGGPGTPPSNPPIPTTPPPSDDGIDDEIITTPQTPGIGPVDGQEEQDPEEPDCDITADQLLVVFPDMTQERRDTMVDFINTYGKELGIDTKEKVCHFLAQTGAETGGFDTFNATENMNYTTAARLTKIYPSKFAINDQGVYTNYDPNDYTNDPEGLANLVYCCKSGNGDEASGDGWRYRGRGCMQLTWRNNYVAYENYLEDIGLEWTYDGPDDVADVETHAILSAMHFFKVNVLDKITVGVATTSDSVTKRVNPGATSEMKTERRDYYTAALAAITCN